MTSDTPEYDLFVIGGGSGGLAAAKEAARYGKKVCIADYVHASAQGTTWGLGGTCLNVGCIPKKLFHISGMIGDTIRKRATSFGWSVNPDENGVIVTHNWNHLVSAVQSHIKGSNWKARTGLISQDITYCNSAASFEDAHTIRLEDNSGRVSYANSKNILIACGGRPSYGGAVGAREHCVTSDDIFTLKKPPGNTLIVGASYIALECAGFLRSLGYEVTVAIRSIVLRGFDRDMSTRIKRSMESLGVKFIEVVPTRYGKDGNGKTVVYHEKPEGVQSVFGEFDTVLLAIGRRGCCGDLDLEKAGIEYTIATGKVKTAYGRTNVSHVYAIGDCVEGSVELTTIAIFDGKLLARSLFGECPDDDVIRVPIGSFGENPSRHAGEMGTAGDKECVIHKPLIPTTVFTPLEYSCVGYTEEEAMECFKDGVNIYHGYIQPLEDIFLHCEAEKPYVKIICLKPTNGGKCLEMADNRTINTNTLTDKDSRITQKERVIGIHLLCEGSGEMIQGYSVAMATGLLTKSLLESSLGIHPTTAEIFSSPLETKSTTDSDPSDAAGC